jgi:16S rRNA (guanine527-N7)-methyltransferase
LIHLQPMLPLPNVQVITHRAEAYRPEHCFDTVTTRAVSSLKEMLTNTQHLCCPQGEFLAMKGRFPEQELTEIPKEFKVVEVVPLKVPYLNADRHLVILQREKADD